MAADYGSDLSCTDDLNPNGLVVSGVTMMAQVCVRRLITRKGSLLSDPLYGIDLRDFLNARIDQAKLNVIGSLSKGELERDERIDRADIITSYSQDTKRLTLKISCTGSLGPFALVLSVSLGQVTVQILSAT